MRKQLVRNTVVKQNDNSGNRYHPILALITVCALPLLSGCETVPVTEQSVSINSEQNACECPAPIDVQQCPDPVVLPVPDEPVKAEAPKVLSCPPPVAAVAKTPRTRRLEDMLVIGRVENVYLPEKLKFRALIETSADLCSIRALEMVEFERDGKPWVRFAVENNKEKVFLERAIKRYHTIKPLNEEELRQPVVTMSITMGSLKERVEVILTENNVNQYTVLIGRNFLRDRALVDVSKKYTATLPAK